MFSSLPLAYYSYSCFFNFIVSGIAATILLIGSKKSKEKFVFAMFASSVSFWSFFYFLWLISPDLKEYSILLRTCMIGVVFMPTIFMHFIYEVVSPNSHKRFIFWNYVFSFLMAPLVFTSWYATDGSPHLVFPFWLKTNWLFHIVLLHFAVLVTYCFYLLIRSIKRTIGLVRNKLLYILIGLIIGYVGGITNYFCWYRIPVPPFLNILVAFYVGFGAYAIMKLGFSEITHAVRNALIYVLSSLFAGAVFAIFGLFIVEKIGFVFVVFMIALSLPVIYILSGKFVAPFVDKRIFRGKFDYIKKLQLFWQNVPIGYSSAQVCWSIVEELSKILAVETISFFVLKEKEGKYIPKTQIGLGNILGDELIPLVLFNKDNFLVKYFTENKTPLYVESNPPKVDGDLYNKALAEMRKIKSDIAFPLMQGTDLIGILNLGKKPNHEMYNKEDIAVITNLAQISATHLAHTLFMEERIIFSARLAHDLKNPLSKVYGIPSKAAKLLNGEIGSLNTEQKKAVEQIQNHASHLNRLTALLTNVTSILSKKLEKRTRKEEPFDYNTYIMSKADSYSAMAKDKNLDFSIVVDKHIPNVYIDQEDIERILENLIGNALKYTPAGAIKLKVENKDGEVITYVSDTGPGIPQTELDTIFDPFYRLKRETIEGSGLGLAIVKELIEAHGGRIWIESTLNQGTTFIFTLLPAIERRGKL